MHLDTSRDVTPRARLRAAGGVPGIQAVLLEPRNKPVQVFSSRTPGQGTHGGREKTATEVLVRCIGTVILILPE